MLDRCLEIQKKERWLKIKYLLRDFYCDINTFQEPSPPDVTSLTATFFILNFLAATQVLKHWKGVNFESYLAEAIAMHSFCFVVETNQRKNAANPGCCCGRLGAHDAQTKERWLRLHLQQRRTGWFFVNVFFNKSPTDNRMVFRLHPLSHHGGGGSCDTWWVFRELSFFNPWFYTHTQNHKNESGQFLLFWGVVFLVTTTLIGGSSTSSVGFNFFIFSNFQAWEKHWRK